MSLKQQNQHQNLSPQVHPLQQMNITNSMIQPTAALSSTITKENENKKYFTVELNSLR